MIWLFFKNKKLEKLVAKQRSEIERALVDGENVERRRDIKEDRESAKDEEIKLLRKELAEFMAKDAVNELQLKAKDLIDEAISVEKKVEKKSETNRRSSRDASLNSGMKELDGPGFYQRLTSCGPNGYACYLLFSKSHNAYKVGISKPMRLGDRLKTIRQSVPDTELAGVAVFTSRQRAFDKEQYVLNKYRDYKYSGMTGRDAAGRQEWITQKPRGSGVPRFMSPRRIEARYTHDINTPIPELHIPDNYTVYLVYSQDKNAYMAKWCKSVNLGNKLREIRKEVPDAKLVARFKIEEHHKAREITKKLNEDSGTYEEEGRDDVVKWAINPSYLEKFTSWDKNGNKKA